MRDIVRYPHLAEWGRVTSYRQGQLDRLASVEVHTGVGEMSTHDVLTYGADKVVIATGASWAADGFGAVTMAPLPGADASLAQICTPEQVMAGKETGERVVVLDYEGYFTGVGMAELLADQGKQVTIVTNWDTVAPHCIYTEEIHDIRRMMHEKNIAQHTLHWAESIDIGSAVNVTIFYLYRDGPVRTMTPKSGEYARRAGTEVTELECDSIILCTARNSNDGLFRELKARHAEWAGQEIQAVYQIGDCHAPRLIANCIFDGHRLAREFESEDPQYPLPWIRERQVWGHETFPKLPG
jgi:dimethylamine/trimethylamine dehydrogenase